MTLHYLQQMSSSSTLPQCFFLLSLSLACGASVSLTKEAPTVPQVGKCPKDCVCSGKAEALRVDCSNLNLSAVPQDIGTTNIAILDLSWNEIRSLREREFSAFLRLQELNLANNLLQTIPESAFLKLSMLRTLHLENNKFARVPSQSFKELVNLESLYLSFNNLLPPSTESFISLPRLKKLFLENANLLEVPVKALMELRKLEVLSLSSNHIRNIPDSAFGNLKRLISLSLENNEMVYIDSNAFNGLVSLEILDMNRNHLKEIPIAISSLTHLKEYSFSDNLIHFLPGSSFTSNKELRIVNFAGNPLESFEKSTFAKLPNLMKLTLSDVRLLEDFPDLKGTSRLEHLRIDRGSLNFVPNDICSLIPLLKSLNLKSNKISEFPVLNGCKALRLIDLSYNNIHFLGENAFINQGKLVDLFLSHNSIEKILKDSFKGLNDLQVLDLESNKIGSIHPDAFVHFKDLRDLNLGANKFARLPTRGLRNLRELKTFNNRQLKEFPPVEAFPRILIMDVSYAYHCCVFMATKNLVQKPSLQETIVWLSKDEVDMSSWSANNISDIWTDSAGNFSSKFEEFANQLMKTFGRDYTIPENLASYAEEYFEEKSLFNHEDSPLAKFALQCRPEPTPFMPCEDLFGWWSLRCGVWVVFLLALLGNGVVVIVLVIGRSKMDVPRFLVCNLAGADFFMGIYLGILAVVDASTLGEFKVSAIAWQNSFGCQIAGFCGVLSSELSVFTLSVITLERNYAITHAMHLNKRLCLRTAGYIMLIGWTFASLMASLPFFGISDYRKFSICLPFETEDISSLFYVVFLILINGVAFLILMLCYLKMYCAIRGSQAWNSNDSRIARRMALLVFTDFVCWAPIAFFSLTAVCGLELINLEGAKISKSNEENLRAQLFSYIFGLLRVYSVLFALFSLGMKLDEGIQQAKVFAIFVLPLNSCANPFLYAIFTKQFKKDCIHICKRIEESRVTRGIGRGRHSSNFSNRHTPVTTNSAAGGGDSECQCGKDQSSKGDGWMEWARKYFPCSRKQIPGEDKDGYTYAIAQIQRNLEKRNKHTTSISSENFSSRSDSWRQGNIPLRLMDSDTKRGSWSLQRKASEDSNMSCSRQDSSTSTFHISRSSFSSDSSTQPRPTRSLLANSKDSFRNKPKLCRQGAVSDERGQQAIKHDAPRHLEKTIEGLCPVCSRKEGFKSKELEEKFACFYNRLVESSCGETSDTFSSKDDQVVLSSEGQNENLLGLIPPKLSGTFQRPHIEVNPMAEKKKSDFKVLKHSFDTIDEEKCRSLVNINKKVSNERAKNSSSENSLIKLSLNSQSCFLQSYTSHESFTGQDCSEIKSNKIGSTKSENIEEENAEKCAQFQDKITRSESAKSDIKCSSLSTQILKENQTKKSISSPNITLKTHETSPLIGSNEE